MSVVDPFGQPGGQVRDDSWPFGTGITISSDVTEPTTEPIVLPELCLCDTPRAATRLDITVENPFIVNCKVALVPEDILSTILKVTVVGNVCGSTESVEILSVGTTPTTTPLCSPNTLGSITNGDWSNNAQVGPFTNAGAEIAGIFLDPADHKILLAQYSTDFGLTWTTVRSTALANTIDSHHARIVAGENAVHAATQESDGRVAYHVFNLGTGTWTLENEQVLASATVATPQVAIEILSPSGDVVIAYGTTESGRNRPAFKRRTAGVWSAETMMGHMGVAQDDNIGGWIRGASNRAWLIGRETAAPNPSFWCQVLQSVGTLSSPLTFRTTGLLSGSATFSIGGAASYVSGADTILAVPIILGGSTHVFFFMDGDTPTAGLTEVELGNFTGAGSSRANVTLVYALGELHTLDWGWPDLVTTTWLRHKTGDTTAFTPTLMDNQIGPQMGTIGATTQLMDGTVTTRICSGVETAYAATFAGLGTVVPYGASTVKFEWTRLSLLPSQVGVDVADWITALSTQTITTCCE